MAVSDSLEKKLQRWVGAGILDPPAADRIRAFEASASGTGIRWQVIIAVAFGAIMVGAGVLLFVAAHWDKLSPAQRFALVLLMVGGFHIAAGAVAPRLRVLGIALHGVGTATLGAGIFLAGQIFNLQEHWPSAVLLWAVGAVLAWVVLRDWLQATLAAILIPAWVASEWGVRAEHYRHADVLLVQFLTLLAVVYLGARSPGCDTNFRRALTWLGGLALLPLCIILAEVSRAYEYPRLVAFSTPAFITAQAGALLLPLLVAWLSRRKQAVWVLGFAVWVVVLAHLDTEQLWQSLAAYGWCALGAIALVLWGLHDKRRERINLGVAGFAITIAAFYFSTMLDKLGRSATLISLGLLFLLGGWKLEQFRRKLVARTTGGAQ